MSLDTDEMYGRAGMAGSWPRRDRNFARLVPIKKVGVVDDDFVLYNNIENCSSIFMYLCLCLMRHCTRFLSSKIVSRFLTHVIFLNALKPGIDTTISTLRTVKILSSIIVKARKHYHVE